MGFPSPAQDYLEGRIDLNNLLMPHRTNMIFMETPEGFVLIDRYQKTKLGDTVAFQIGDYQLDDNLRLGKLFSSGIITQDGETIDGEGLEGVIVLGKVTATILAVYEPCRPII